METALIDLSAAAVRVDATALGEPGQRLQVINVGDDPAFWRVSAGDPAGAPGFPLRRGQRHQITLPAEGLAIWGWSPGKSRLAVTPFIGETGIATGATGELRVGPTPVQVPGPVGAAVGTSFKAVNAGLEAVSFLQSRLAPTPEPVGGVPVGPGEEFGLAVAAEDYAAWAWSLGSVLLIQATDGGWSFGA